MNPEEEPITDTDINAAVSSLMDELPVPVQEFLKSNERDQVVRELSAKYSLHVDQAGEFERAFLFMLLGISKPEEFVSNLRTTGLTEDVIGGLATDVNTRVFIPLREKEREASRVQPLQAQPAKPAPLPPPALAYEPAAPTLPGSPVPAPMPPSVPVMVQPAPQQHIVHTMTDAQNPQGWHPAAAVHIFVPSHGAPAQAIHQPVAAPAMTPSVPVQTAPTPEPYVPPAPVVVPSAQITSETPLKKDYAADPYRESI